MTETAEDKPVHYFEPDSRYTEGDPLFGWRSFQYCTEVERSKTEYREDVLVYEAKGFSLSAHFDTFETKAFKVWPEKVLSELKSAADRYPEKFLGIISHDVLTDILINPNWPQSRPAYDDLDELGFVFDEEQAAALQKKYKGHALVRYTNSPGWDLTVYDSIMDKLAARNVYMDFVRDTATLNCFVSPLTAETLAGSMDAYLKLAEIEKDLYREISEIKNQFEKKRKGFPELD